MTRYGMFAFLGRGHLDPALAIGRGLQRRGHEVTVFHLTIAQAAIRAASLRFAPLDRNEPPAPLRRGAAGERWQPTVDAIRGHALRTLREAPEALRAAGVDAVVGDQLDVGAATVAERLRLPFVSLSCSPPIYLDETVPPPFFDWPPAADEPARMRNARANGLVERAAVPVMRLVNRQRLAWSLPPIARVNDLFSNRAIVTQLPETLELPRQRPAHLHYTAQFRDEGVEATPPFEWTALSERPLVYASMGTIRNTSVEVFRTIAAACAAFDVQLVLSLGGGLLTRADLGPLPGAPMIVHYAPQRALLRRAVLTINCGGLNTTLECLRNGVPLVAIPVGEDQPGVAARVAAAQVGVVIPARQLTVAALREAIARLLAGECRGAAERVQQQLQRIDGVERAVDLIERAA